MLKSFSQLDPKWARNTLGKSIYTIRDWGCTISSICSMHSKIYPKSKLLPSEAAKLFKFDNQGRLFWKSTDFPGMKFAHRGYGRPSKNDATHYANNKESGMILELRRNPRHWVFLHKWGSNFLSSFWPYFLAMDPLKGKIVRIRKSEISGYAKFIKNSS